jgi:hypothetical protein
MYSYRKTRSQTRLPQHPLPAHLAKVSAILLATVLASWSPTGASTATAASGRLSTPSVPKPRPTMTYFILDMVSLYGEVNGGILVVNADGSVSVRGVNLDGPPPKLKFAPVHTISNLVNAVSVSAYAPFIATSDGSWWGIQPGSARRLPTNPNYPIVDLVGGYKPLTWALYSNGSAALVGGGLQDKKPGSKLDHIVKLCAQQGSRGSERLAMLRADGTVWIDGNHPELMGWVMADGELGSTQLKGLDHIKDLAVYSPYGVTDTGVALREDGSVLYWGMPPADETANENLPLDTPQIKRLAGPEGVVKVAAGMDIGGVIDGAGKMWTWNHSSPPKVVEGIENVVDMQFSRQVTLALCKDGTVWAWWPGLPPQKIFENVKLPSQGTNR